MTSVRITYRIEERLAGKPQAGWARGTVSRENVIELFDVLVAEDAASDAPVFGPYSGHRLVVLAEPPLRLTDRPRPPAESARRCGQTVDDAGKQVCGRPVTDAVSWADRSRPEYPPVTEADPYLGIHIDEAGHFTYTTYYPHQVVKLVCGSCADALMGWAATHLNPTRRPLAVTR